MNPETLIQEKVSAVMNVNLEIFKQIKVIPPETEIVIGWNVHFNSVTRKLEKIPTISTVGNLIKGWSYTGEALEIIECGPESLSFNLSTFPDIKTCLYSLRGVFVMINSLEELSIPNTSRKKCETFQAILRNLERVQVALGEIQSLLISLEDIFDDSPEGDVEAMSKIVKGSQRYDLDLKCTIGRPERIKSPEETELEELVRTMMLVSTLDDFGEKIPQNERIRLRNLELTVFPKGVLRFSELTSLNLSENQLSEIPESIGELVNLKYLYISDNRLSEIPESIGSLAKLESLDVSNNQLFEIPESIGGLSKLKYLDISSNQLSEIPESIGGLSKLKFLYISSNQLSELPEIIGGLSKLKHLYIMKNQFSELPESIGSLTRLDSLDISSNQLSEIPESIGGLSKLKYLYISSNQLSELPHTVKQLIALKELNISRNQFSTIPECTYSLENLTYFGFSSQNTGVKLSLPPGIFKYLDSSGACDW